jgi:exopolysaccharide biosynthesis polyprenyl glycosylphosphotransferase
MAAALWGGGVIAAFFHYRLYDEDTLLPGGGEASRIVRVLLEVLAVLCAFAFFTHTFHISRLWIGLLVLFSFVSLVAERLTFRLGLERARRRGIFNRPVILVAKDQSWRRAFPKQLQEFVVVGHAAGPDELLTCFRREGGFAGRVRDRFAPPAAVIKSSDFDESELWGIFVRAGELRIPALIDSPVRSVGRARLSTRDMNGHTIVKVGPPRLSGIQAAEKRLLELFLSLVALIILAPLLLLVAVAILLTSGWPILYKQTRVGLRGRQFEILKFRTMRRDAEAGSGPVWATRNDPRRTGLGSFLRRMSIDELPQLINVLKGDMSIVGPRPERPPFVTEFSAQLPWYRDRHRIRPGITGLAQASGLRGNTPVDSRLEADNWYIENWSLGLDMKILLRTLKEVISGDNAC